MMTLIDNGGKNNVGRTSPIWDNVASESSNMRTPLQYFEHYQDMRQAMKTGKSNVVKYLPGSYYAHLLKLMTSGNKIYKAR